MAQHPGHQTGISSLPSLAQLVTPWHPHANVSLPAAVSSAPNEPALSATPPRACEVPHLHIQINKRLYQHLYHIHMAFYLKNNKNIHIKYHHHTSVIKHLPWR
jgi:hypothetical protein